MQGLAGAGDQRDQIRALKQAGRLAEAEALLRAALAERPGDPWLRVSLADLYMRQDKLLEAEHLAAEVLAARPDHAGALTVLGNLQARERRYEEARQSFELAARAGGGEYVLGRLVDVYLHLGRHQEALDLCRRELEGRPDSLRFLRGLARAQERLGQTEGAAATYRRILELAPDDAFAYSRLARLQTADQDPARAARELERLLQVGARSQNPHLHALAGDKKRAAGDLAGAAAAYARAVELAPDDLYARKQLGYCLVRLGRHGEAVAVLREAVLREPGDYYARNSLAAAARRAGLAPDLAQFLRAAIAGHPERRPLWGLVRQLESGREAP